MSSSSVASNDQEASDAEEADGGRGSEMRDHDEEADNVEEVQAAVTFLFYEPHDGFAALDGNAQLNWLVKHARKTFGSQFEKDSSKRNDAIDAYLALLIRDFIVEPLLDLVPPKTSKKLLLGYINKRMFLGSPGSELRDLAGQVEESTDGNHYENVPNGGKNRMKSYFYLKTIKEILDKMSGKIDEHLALEWFESFRQEDLEVSNAGRTRGIMKFQPIWS